MRTKKLFDYLIIFFLVCALPYVARAQTSEQNYYESSSAISSESITLSSFNAVYQTFYPRNDFVSGFDIWVSNTGERGTLHFALLDNTSTTLISKTVSVNPLASQWDGTRIHLDLESNVPVSSDALYTLKLWTSMPQLKIYYINGVTILEHNASATLNAEPIVRTAYLDSTEQPFVFKIAFYEKSTDVTPPTISNLSFIAPSDDEMQVNLNANEPVDYRIDYRATFAQNGIIDIHAGSFTNAFNMCTTAMTPCAFTIPVYPNMTYAYTIYARDYWNNETTISGTFDSSKNDSFQIYPTSTPATTTSTESIISNASVFSVTPTSAQFTWETNIPSASRMVISTDPEYRNVVTRLGDTTFELYHSMNTGNILTPNTQYYALIVADSYSNILEGVSLTFLTPSASPITPESTSTPTPVIPPPPPTPQIPEPVTIRSIIDNAFSDNAPAPVSNQNQQLPPLLITQEKNGNATIHWNAPLTTSENYLVDIFDMRQTLVRRVTVTGGVQNITIDSLPPGEYRAIVYANTNGLHEKVAQSTNFNTTPKGKSFWENIGSESVLFGVAGFGFIMIMIAIVLAIIKKNEIANI